MFCSFYGGLVKLNMVVEGLEWFGVVLSYSMDCSLTDFFQPMAIDRTSSKFMKEVMQPLEILMLSIGDSFIK